MQALDVIVTAGRSAPSLEREERVVRALARMLGARVLMHRVGKQYLTCIPQSEHTLSTWSLLRLARERRIVARKVRPRPEFWRPEQRRPGGVLSFPIGKGTATIARTAPFRPREVRAVRSVLRFFADRQAQDAPTTQAPAVRPPKPAPPVLKGLVGDSRPWRNVLSRVWKVAPSKCTVLIEGETGTGKERVAEAIHLASPRAQAPFLAVNCGALHGDTLQSELFGHVRGAFTGAERQREGIFCRAHRGTLFLDEVADMPPPMQIALLRVLEEHVIRPLGSSRARKVDVRVCAATNRNLEEAVRAGEFREDLFHRLNVVRLHLPPLRTRKSDLPLLANHLLGRMEEPKSLHMDALPHLARHPWHGNVRELDNVLQAAALLTEGPEIRPDLLQRLLRERPVRPRTRRASLTPRASELLGSLGKQWRSAPELAAHLQVSTRTVNRDLKHLIDHGLVEVFGQARARRYRRAR